MLDTHRDALRHLVATYQRERAASKHVQAPSASLNPDDFAEDAEHTGLADSAKHADHTSHAGDPASDAARHRTPYRALFVEPLLAMLGWQVGGRAGDMAWAPWPKEAALEPGYVFEAQGTRRFMLATAPAGYDFDALARPALHLRQRAWSAHLPLAVLTHIEGIHLYDTRIRPDARDDASVTLRLQVPWDEITQRYDELADVLSKAAVQSGGFDTFAYAPAKRTATVRQAFLADAKRWREALAAPRKAAHAVLEGVVCLAIAKARDSRLGSPWRDIVAADDVRVALLQAWQATAHTLGVPMFADAQTQVMQVAHGPLQAVLQQMIMASAYDFGWLPDDLLGQIHEAWLALKPANALPAEQTAIPTTPPAKARKSAGAFYTPSPVVRHIVRHVMRRLASRTPPAAAEHHLPDDLPLGGTAPAVRVLDPACGAGAFLVEIYRVLLDATHTRYSSSDPRENPRMTELAPGVWGLSLREKTRLLTTHIFGVDIDPAAVAVTKRALWLLALAGAPVRAAAKLPALDSNIKCGNMLIGPDFCDPAETPHAAQVRNAPQAQNVPQARDDSPNASFDWRTAFPQAAQAGGFDAVVGNPPYGTEFSPAQRAYIKTHFLHQSYRADSYLLFMELCLRAWVRPDGYCGLIIPNPWLTNLKQRPLRTFVLQNAAIEQVVHFGCAMFKAHAVVDTQIVLMQRRAPEYHHVHTHLVHACEPSGSIDLRSATTMLHDQAAWLNQADDAINIFVDDARRALAAKIKAAGAPASTYLQICVGLKPYQVGKGRPKQTPQMVRDRVFDADHAVTDTHRRYLRGADIKQYKVHPVCDRYISYGPWLAEPRTAAGFDAPKKLVMRQTSDHLVAAIDADGRLCMNNMHVLLPKVTGCDLDAIMGLFNSRLMNWYYQVLNPERGEALAEVKTYHVESLPVPWDLEKFSQLGAIARKIAATDDIATCDALKAQLHAHVEAWFELSPDEIGIIHTDSTH